MHDRTLIPLAGPPLRVVLSVPPIVIEMSRRAAPEAVS